MNLLRTANDKLPSDKKISFHLAEAKLVLSGYTNDFVPSGSFDEPNTIQSDQKWAKKWRGFWEDERSVCKETLIGIWYDSDGNSLNEAKFSYLKEHEIKSTDFDFFTKLFNPSLNEIEEEWYLNSKLWNGNRHNYIEGYTGNEGNSKFTTYKKYALVIWQNKCEFSFLSKISYTYATKLLHKSLVKNTNELELKKKFDILMEAMQNTNLNINDKTALELITDLLERFNDPEQFKRLWKKLIIYFPKRLVAKLIIHFNATFFKDAFIERLSSSSFIETEIKDNCCLIQVIQFFLLNFISFVIFFQI